jgi:hypothetical protein
MSKRIPVAVFAYNRPAHIRRALQALSQCRRLDECEFHFFADGPRSEDVRQQVEATRQVLREWAPALNACVVERDGNLGLAKSIVSGVTDLCTRYGRVIVLEDDLVVSPDFLHYMIESLDRYQNDDRVMQVGAFTLSSPLAPVADAFLLPVTTTWGWATWQRAWESFSWVPEDLEAARRDDQWRKLFDLNGSCNFSAMLEDRLAGRNDSWGILWWYAVSRRQGLVVYPTHSLVWNGGFDGSGVHCGSGDFFDQGDVAPRPLTRLPDALAFSPEIRYVPAHLVQLEDFFRSRASSSQPAGRTGTARRLLRSLALKLQARLRHAIH